MRLERRHEHLLHTGSGLAHLAFRSTRQSRQPAVRHRASGGRPVRSDGGATGNHPSKRPAGIPTVPLLPCDALAANLLLDDVQFLANKVNTQEMFFYIYTNMINNGKQIVITSDHQPNELNKLEERLVTRFSQGLVVKIEEPDQNTCVEILRKKIEALGLDVNRFDENVLYFYADKFSKNVRELEGALHRLIFVTTNIKKTDKVTIEDAMEAVSSLVGGKQFTTQLSEQKIINVVADYYNLTPSQITGKIRTGQIALARHIAMYLIRQMLDVPLKKIGDMFGGKDHTTVMSAISKVDKELKTNESLKEAITELEKRLKP